jgi:glycerol uptake facilitator protein
MPASSSRLGAEFIGTLFLVFFGAGAGTHAVGGLTGVALAHAFALAIAVWVFGPLSGAHVNPAVTIALALRNRLSWAEAGLYIVAQLLGGVVAALLLWAVFGGGGVDSGLGATHVGDGVTVVGALLAEIIGTFLLVSAVYIAAVQERVPAGFAALVIGLALGAAILAVGPASGASLNPARTFGPELVLALGGGPSDWANIWIYLVGPVLGGAAAVFVQDFLIQAPPRTGTGTTTRRS